MEIEQVILYHFFKWNYILLFYNFEQAVTPRCFYLEL